MPLADEHFHWEFELDSDPEVMRHLSGRACTRDEVEASHARRTAAVQKVDGLGFWVGLVDDEFVGFPAAAAALAQGVASRRGAGTGSLRL